MNTYPVSIQQAQRLQTGSRQQLIPAMIVSSRETLALWGAVMAAMALVLFFVWVASTATNNLIAGGTWGLGFIFLGLAADNRKRTAILQLTMGIALLGLALLQVAVSPDFILVSGTLIATWVAVTVFRQLQ